MCRPRSPVTPAVWLSCFESGPPWLRTDFSKMGKNTRYAHSEGYTCVCFDESGECMLTGGSDGEVRIWKGLDEDPVDHRIGDKIYAIVARNGRFFVSAESNSVQAYTYPGVQLDGVIVRFTAPVNHIDVGKSGQYLVAGSSDFTMKLVNLVDNSIKHFQGHDAPVLSVCLDPINEFVASSSCDGTVRIWEISTQTCVKTLMSVLPKSNNSSSSKALCQVHWQPTSGRLLAVPTFHEIHLYERSSWTELHKIKEESSLEIMNLARFSPCGNYLAAATVQGTVFIWGISSKKLIEKYQHEKKLTICSLDWNPSGKKEIAFCDTDGQLDVLDNIMLNEPVTLKQTEEILHDNFENASTNANIKIADIPGILGEDTDSLNANITDEQNLYHFDSDLDDDCTIHFDPYKAKLYDFQKPFQPGSTPYYLEDRFMAWNSAGTICCRNTDKELTIEIEFEDASGRRCITLENNRGYAMAALSKEVAVFACNAQPDQSNKLASVQFISRDRMIEWTVNMPDDEIIQALAIGEKWIAACTDAQNLFIYSSSGIAQKVIPLPGPVVCMSGSSQFLVVVYHNQKGVAGSQCQSAMMIAGLVGNETVAVESLALPLPKRAVLSWIGFTDEASTLCMADSNGLVSLLSGTSQMWIPIANTKLEVQDKSNNFFVLGVNEMKQEIRCVECNASKYPPTSPRPEITVLPFKLPHCELETEKGQLEERFWKNKLRLETLSKLGNDFEVDMSIVNLSRKFYRETLMKLFALSCNSERALRAYELCKLMDSSHNVQLAIKYAAKLNRTQLTERLAEVAREKMQAELELEKEQESQVLENDCEMSEMEAEEDFARSNKDCFSQENVDIEFACEPSGSTGYDEPLYERQSDKATNVRTLLSIWIEENRAEFESKYPDASDAQISIMAIKAFKSVPPEEIEELKNRVQNEDEHSSSRKTRCSKTTESLPKRPKLTN